MKLSNEILVNSIGVLSRLNAIEFDVKISYIVAKNVEKISEELKVYNEQRQKLIDKYSVKDEEGKTKVKTEGTIEIQEKLINSWNSDMSELLSCENDIDIQLIKLEDLFKCDFSITPIDLKTIDFMIKE